MTAAGCGPGASGLISRAGAPCEPTVRRSGMPAEYRGRSEEPTEAGPFWRMRDAMDVLKRVRQETALRAYKYAGDMPWVRASSEVGSCSCSNIEEALELGEARLGVV